MLRYILALNSCSRTRNRAKSTIPGIVQQSLLLGDLGIYGLAPRVQSSGDSNMCVQAILPSSPVLSSSAPTHGLTQLGLGSYPSGSFVPETVTTLFLFIGPDRPVYTTALVRPLGPCQPTSAVAGPVFSYLWNPYPSVSGGITIFTDASTQGWGAHMGNSQILGSWAPLDRQLHINCFELKAVEADFIIGPQCFRATR